MTRGLSPSRNEIIRRAAAPLTSSTGRECIPDVNSNQFKRWLADRGCTFETTKGGHLRVRRGDRKSVLPMHGSRKELGKGLVEDIKEQLGLKDEKQAR